MRDNPLRPGAHNGPTTRRAPPAPVDAERPLSLSLGPDLPSGWAAGWRWAALGPLVCVSAVVVAAEGLVVWAAVAARWGGGGVWDAEFARALAANIAHYLFLSGNALLLGWLALLLTAAGAGRPVQAQLRERLVGWLAAAVAVGTLGGMLVVAQLDREGPLLSLMVLYGPTLAVCVPLVWTALPGLGSWPGRLGVVAGFVAGAVWSQSRYVRMGEDEPPEAALVLNSLLIGGAVTVRLVVWARSDSSEEPYLSHE